jgi:Skp family chaperone for outer membrane proteins
MSRTKTKLFSLLLAVSAVATTAPAAFAQGTVVVAIDEGRIFRDSKVGKDIQNKLKNIQTQIRGEVEPTQKSLEAEGKTLDAKLKGKTREQVAADAALVGQMQALEKKATDFAVKSQTVSQEYAMTERQARIDFSKALQPVMLEVIKEKGAQIVVDRSGVVYVADAVDVSAAVISKLDAKTPSMTVTRQRAPAATAPKK